MRWLVAVASVVTLVASCKDKAKDKITVKGVIVMPACKQAIDEATSAPLNARPQLLIDGCHVCADWKPLLAWDTEPEHGGPKREQIEHVMVACDAFCTGDSKLKFMAAVDKARGKHVDVPWRQLENACKTKVNGAADDRFMSAPFFALDRIGRAVPRVPDSAALAQKLAAIELPLPALTISGAGPALPTTDTTGPTGSLQITVLGDAIYIGRMPRGRLTATGVTAELGAQGYPGEQVKLDQLAAKLQELAGADKAQPITMLAPHAMPAHKLVPIIAAAAPAPLYLAAHAKESPEGWQLAGAIPIALEAGDQIKVTEQMTVQDLARELAARVARKESRVGVAKN